jgi:hypothetical protein
MNQNCFIAQASGAILTNYCGIELFVILINYQIFFNIFSLPVAALAAGI